MKAPTVIKAIPLLLAASVTVMAAPQSSLQVIDTLSSWDGTADIRSFGEPDTAYFGQSFVALDSEINSVAFMLDGLDWEGAPYPTEFHLLLAPLAQTRDRPDLDSILFESANLSTTLESGFELFEVQLNTSVVPGKDYVWIIDAFVLHDEQHGTAAIAANLGSYADGEFLFWNVGPFDPGVRRDHDEAPWDTWGIDGDAAFRIGFVPEPRSVFYLAALLLLLLLRRVLPRDPMLLLRDFAVLEIPSAESAKRKEVN